MLSENLIYHYLSRKHMNSELNSSNSKLDFWKNYFQDKYQSILSSAPKAEEIDVQAADEEEMSQSAQLQKMTNTLQQRNRQALFRIEKALNRINKGEFGLCQDCGEHIAEARLKALPDADVCISCAENQEIQKKFYV